MTRLEAVRCVTWIITGCTFFLFFSMNPWACHLDSSWRILLVLRLAFNSAFRKEHAFLMSMTSFRPLFPLLGFLHWDTRCSFFFFFFFFGEFHTASLTTSTPLSPLPEHTHTLYYFFFFLKTDSNFIVSQQKQGDVTGARLADRCGGGGVCVDKEVEQSKEVLHNADIKMHGQTSRICVLTIYFLGAGEYQRCQISSASSVRVWEQQEVDGVWLMVGENESEDEIQLSSAWAVWKLSNFGALMWLYTFI